jgi:hypothetical protein
MITINVISILWAAHSLCFSPAMAAIAMIPCADVGGGQHANALAPSPQSSAGFVVHRIWSPERITANGPAGTIEVTADPDHLLVVLEVTAAGELPIAATVDQIAAVGDGVTIAPIGAAPFSLGNFGGFSGFVSGWRIVSDADGRDVKVGRDSETQPIELTVAPGARVSIVYIVPEEGQPMVVTLPGAGEVPLVPSS